MGTALSSRGTASLSEILVNGEATWNRLLNTGSQSPLTSGQIQLAYFVAQVTEYVTAITTGCEGTAAGTVTANAIGIYSVNTGTGNLTLLSSVADNTLWTSTYSVYTQTLSAPLLKQAGVTYAIGCLSIAVTEPTLTGVNVAGSSANFSSKTLADVTGQTGLPSSISGASALNSYYAPWAALTH